MLFPGSLYLFGKRGGGFQKAAYIVQSLRQVGEGAQSHFSALAFKKGDPACKQSRAWQKQKAPGHREASQPSAGESRAAPSRGHLLWVLAGATAPQTGGRSRITAKPAGKREQKVSIKKDKFSFQIKLWLILKVKETDRQHRPRQSPGSLLSL